MAEGATAGDGAGAERLSRSDKPVIAVSVPVHVAPDSPTLQTVVEAGYLKGAEIAGGLPVVVSPVLDEGTSAALLEVSDGLILSGGEDVHPARYGEQNAAAEEVSTERDHLEMEVTEWALENALPTLAICRGMQLLNVALGGSLFQDLASQADTEIDHDRAGTEVSRAVHTVRVEGTSLLDGVFSDNPFHTNSTHHQAIRELGEGLIPVAWAEDGIVEAVEYRGDRFDGWVAGVQWHPERMLDEPTGTNRAIFERFGQVVQQRMEGA